MDTDADYNKLSDAELESFMEVSRCCKFRDGESIFSEGDEADAMYVLDSGTVVISIEKSGRQLTVAELGKNTVFGEMALLNQDARNASATARGDVTAYCIRQEEFNGLLAGNHTVAERIKALIELRNNELMLKEQLVAITGVGQEHLHVAIAGDPSMRETAFSRNRYENVVDSVLPKLVPSLRKLLFDTSAYRVFMGLNNGEVRISSVINPFVEEMHTAKKISSLAYIDRHFPPMDYETKSNLMREVGAYVEASSGFAKLPESWADALRRVHREWRPVEREQLETVLDRLLDMRRIPDFYLRNMSISVAQDAVRMQFNCDGTHIVSTGEYEHFLEENIEFES